MAVSKITRSIRQIWNRFSDKEYRHGFVEGTIEDSVAVQIYSMRRDRGWTQDKLATELGTKQSAVCRLEGGDQLPSLRNLLKVAAVFDVALAVKFVPFSEFLIGDGRAPDRSLASYVDDGLYSETYAEMVSSASLPDSARWHFATAADAKVFLTGEFEVQTASSWMKPEIFIPAEKEAI